MSGNSWRGSPAATRKHAFEKLQDASLAIESAEVGIIEAEVELKRLVREAEVELKRVTALCSSKLGELRKTRLKAEKSKDEAMALLMEAMPDPISDPEPRHMIEQKCIAPQLPPDVC